MSMPFPDRLKTLYLSNGYSQTQLADLIGVSQQTISRWVTGKFQPDIDQLIACAKLFNVSVDYLVGISDNPVLYADTQKNPSPEARRRTVAAAADAREGAAPPASNLTEADRRWIEERIRIALGSNPTDNTQRPDD